MAQLVHVFQFHQKPGAGAQAADYWRQCDDDAGVADLAQIARRLLRHRAGALFGPRAQAPVAQPHEGAGGGLAATQAGHGIDAHHFGHAAEVLGDFVGDGIGALGRGAGRQVDDDGERALILFRHEAGGQAVEHPGDPGANQQVHQHHSARAPHEAARPGHGAVGGAVEAAVEAVEKTVAQAQQAFALLARFSGRAQQGRAQGRRQRQRHQHRQHHGRHDGDRELPVDDAGGSAEERHGNEHRRKCHRDAHQRGRDLAHRLARGFFRRQVFGVHHPLDVFHHHNGVVHQQADGQHQPEHGQRVDGVAGDRQHAKGAQQDDGYGDGRNQRGAQVLHEQEHHQNDQHHRLD